LNNFDVVRALVVSTIGPQTALQRFYFSVAGIGGSPTDVQFATEFDTAVAALFKACIASTASYRGVSAQILRPFPSPATATSFDLFTQAIFTGSEGVGTRGATVLPGQVRGLVSFKGNVAARGLNCRTYMPWPSSADLTADGLTPSTSYQTAIGTFAQEVVVFNALNDGAGNTANVSLIDFRIKTPATPIFEFLRSTIVRPRWATQRRSGAYGRPNATPF
jgi:hypothetical protein